MTNDDFRNREQDVPGYIDAVYIAGWKFAKHSSEVEAKDPIENRLKDAVKVGLDFKYCHYKLDTENPTFKDALAISSYKPNECWINAIVEKYGESLMRSKKRSNVVNRETILKLVGRSEANIADGLTVHEILPFFQRYKLRLRVYDVFFRLIFKYDPETENRRHPPMFCVCDGNHVYLLNRDLDQLAQKASSEDFTVSASSNFNTLEKPTEPAKYHCIEHIDDILKIIANLPETEEKKMIYLIQKKDNLEELIWQLFHAGYRPNVKYGAGRLSWISLTLNNYYFLIKTQQLIDYAIDGMLQIEKAEVFNRTQDAKDDFYAKLFRADHKSYYSDSDVAILDECRTTANVGFLSKLEGVSLSIRLRPPTIPKSSLVEIDITKAYTAAFIRIQEIPIFNEFDVWLPYAKGEKLKDLSLYLVEAVSFDLFFNKRFNICYGLFLKQTTASYRIRAVKHPSITKKVNYKDLIHDLWSVKISDNYEEDQLLKKTIVNCSYGVLEKQVNKAQRSKLFDSFEEAKFYAERFGGTIGFINEYEEYRESVESHSLDKDVEDEEPAIAGLSKSVATGNTLYIMNVKAEVSMTNGFRLIKELLLQHHNFYLQKNLHHLERKRHPCLYGQDRRFHNYKISTRGGEGMAELAKRYRELEIEPRKRYNFPYGRNAIASQRKQAHRNTTAKNKPNTSLDRRRIRSR